MSKIVSTYLCVNCGTMFGSSQEQRPKCIRCGDNKTVPCETRTFTKYKVLPFNISLDEAIKQYKNRIKYNPLVSISLRSKDAINMIKGVYIPCTLYSVKVTGNITVTGNLKGDPRVYEALFDTDSEYLLLNSTITEVDNGIIEAINDYSFDNTSFFDDTVINEEIIIGKNIDNSEEIIKKMEKNTISIIKKNSNYINKKIKNNNLKTNIISKDCYMIPVYYLSMNNKDDKHLFLMNGFTGKVYCFPNISIFSVIVLTIIIFIMMFLFGMILEYYL